MNNDIAKRNASFYWEFCFLRRLLSIGLIDQKDFEGICHIAAEDYEATLLV